MRWVLVLLIVATIGVAAVVMLRRRGPTATDPGGFLSRDLPAPVTGGQESTAQPMGPKQSQSTSTSSPPSPSPFAPDATVVAPKRQVVDSSTAFVNTSVKTPTLADGRPEDDTGTPTFASKAATVVADPGEAARAKAQADGEAAARAAAAKAQADAASAGQARAAAQAAGLAQAMAASRAAIPAPKSAQASSAISASAPTPRAPTPSILVRPTTRSGAGHF